MISPFLFLIETKFSTHMECQMGKMILVESNFCTSLNIIGSNRALIEH